MYEHGDAICQQCRPWIGLKAWITSTSVRKHGSSVRKHGSSVRKHGSSVREHGRIVRKHCSSARVSVLKHNAPRGFICL